MDGRVGRKTEGARAHRTQLVKGLLQPTLPQAPRGNCEAVSANVHLQGDGLATETSSELVIN